MKNAFTLLFILVLSQVAVDVPSAGAEVLAPGSSALCGRYLTSLRRMNFGNDGDIYSFIYDTSTPYLENAFGEMNENWPPECNWSMSGSRRKAIAALTDLGETPAAKYLRNLMRSGELVNAVMGEASGDDAEYCKEKNMTLFFKNGCRIDLAFDFST